MMTIPVPPPDQCLPEFAPEDDQKLYKAVMRHLQASGYLQLRRLRCEVADGMVTLSGRVPSFHLKQVAQAAVLRIAAVRKVENLVQVC
jgi:osmotically-inducible protein OsmY